MSETKSCSNGAMFLGAVVIAIQVLAVHIGWIYAHQVIAKDCQKLNAFYVGDRVYECKVRQ